YTEDYNLEFTFISFFRVKRDIYVTMDGGFLGRVQFNFDMNAIRRISTYTKNKDIDLEYIPLKKMIDIAYELYKIASRMNQIIICIH
ncbi:hypothetical protein COF65_32100, partial [Bacillus toyonensis]